MALANASTRTSHKLSKKLRSSKLFSPGNQQQKQNRYYCCRDQYRGIKAGKRWTPQKRRKQQTERYNQSHNNLRRKNRHNQGYGHQENSVPLSQKPVVIGLIVIDVSHLKQKIMQETGHQEGEQKDHEIQLLMHYEHPQDDGFFSISE